ncbi:MAG: mechanosensitive ion channel family protein [Pirellulales bacterium]|nr:mechanosensitive ion channel family protein [Pirellulales bacterium]
MRYVARTVFLCTLAATILASRYAVAQTDKIENPRAAMRIFIDSSNAGDDATAAEVLDFSGLAQAPSEAEKEELARKIKAILDRQWYVSYKALSDKPDAEPFRMPPDAVEQPLELARSDDGGWRFSADTVAKADELYEQYKDAPLLAGPPPWYQKIKFGDNALWRIGALFLAILIAFIVSRIARAILNHTATGFENRNRALTGAMFRALGQSAGFFLFVIGLRIGAAFLVLNTTVESIVGTCTSILMALAFAFVAWNMVSVVDAWLRNFAERTSSTLDDMLVPMVRASLRVTIVVLVLVQIATILSDKPVTSVIAGLGVGGLAIGLAAQDMIKNFFGSIMIFSDRPFELGDRIVVDGFDGPVEKVGFRSTQIRTLDGHLVTIPNGELANASIRNIGKRPHIKRAFDLGVTYDTTPEKLRQAMDIVKEILTDHEGMDPDIPPRVYFNGFGDSALNIQVIYWYHPPAYWDYSEFSQNVNMQILERFNAEGIEFAFPSQTIYMAGGAAG